MITFEQIPPSIGVPGTYGEFNGSNARRTAGTKRYVNLILGQMSDELAHTVYGMPYGQPLTTNYLVATARPNMPYLVTSAKQAGELFGVGSIIHHQAITHFKTNPRSETYFCGQKPNEQGIARIITADYNINYVVNANKAGIERIYIGEAEYFVSVKSGDTTVQITDKLVSLINLDVNRLFNASASAGVLTLTARNKGELYNDIQIISQYRTTDIPASPTGLFTTFLQTTAGQLNPSLATAINNIQSSYYTHVVCPYNDELNANLLLIEAQNRWSPLPNETSLGNGQEDFVIFSAYRASEGGLMAFMSNRNSQHRTVMAVEAGKTVDGIVYAGLMSSIFQVATAYGSTSSRLTDIVANQPHQQVVMSALKSAPLPSRFSWVERNRFILNYGLATYNYNQDSQVVLENAITERTATDNGTPSDAERRVETQFTNSYIRWSTRQMLETQYPAHRLADDGTIGLPSNVATPSMIKGSLLSLALNTWLPLGIIENFEQFAADLVVERSINDCNTINIRMFPDLINILSVKALGIHYIVC